VDNQGKFRNWLRSFDSKKNAFWVSGKPGAGKSTLLKSIARHRGLQKHPRSWSGSLALATVEFYFWRHGAPLQRSSNGLLRSLLYQVLKAHPVLLHHAFPNREWISGGSKFDFGQDSLYQGLQGVIRAAERYGIWLFFLMDGLDEVPE
jgi:hypothetical protein